MMQGQKKKKKHSFVDAHAMNIMQSFSFNPHIVSEELIFKYFFLEI